jgi:hypothetical protein
MSETVISNDDWLEFCRGCGHDEFEVRWRRNSEGVNYCYEACRGCGANYIRQSEKQRREHGVISV